MVNILDIFTCLNSYFDTIYDSLIKVRHKIAKKLGFDNFVEVAYLRMSRSDYNHVDVANYRKQVLESLVPITTELLKRKQKRLGLNELHYHDEGLEFTSGNAKPKGSPEWILDQGKTMYKELSKETHEFFTVMTEKNLLDLVSREGKAPGGYCTYIANEKVPFIYSNFNGTSGDVDVLTHEAGHAFQVYSSRNFKVLEYNWPTTEACEIHSMSMEFFAWPWMNLFFKEDETKYKFSHLSSGLTFIPYGVTVDEFQHFIYEHPDASPDERKAKWREIEKKYLPLRNYAEYPFLEKGTYWFSQMHIFEMPMYYIDYTLAQVCAYQFWIKSQDDESKNQAWQDYLKLCQAGGSVSFLKLIELANLDNPFEDGSIAKIAGPIKNYLQNVDDTKL
ncbi:M3 family oligoendopeptidase [Fusibacter sp. JL216-2]|uniref:M3 family oligoendopeptidase n=1 Tax=Fusibacter sp. JL216-2 TaxID=3071453 RepID=UPI003D3441AB